MIVHCKSEGQAEAVLEAIRDRLAEVRSGASSEKTKIVYCQDDDRTGTGRARPVRLPGYTFQPRRAKNRWGKSFVSFLPAISNKAAKAIRETIRDWRLASTRNNQCWRIWPAGQPFGTRLGELLRPVLPVEVCPGPAPSQRGPRAWARRKYKRFRRRERASVHWLGRIAQRDRSCLSCGSSA